MRTLTIAIAGCGPAGLAAALLLHRDGHRVTLFERFEAPKPIGSGLMIQPTGLAVLKELGLAERLVGHGARIEKLFGTTGDTGRVVLDVRYAALGRRAGFGIGVHRAALFAVLHDAVAAEGIAIETSRTITASAEVAGGHRRLQFADGTDAGPFDLVVDALGTRTPLTPPTGRVLPYGALWASLDWQADAGFDAAALEQRYRAASIMAGILPIGTPPGWKTPQTAFFWSLRLDGFDVWRKRGLNAWKAEVFALWPQTMPVLDQIDHADQMTLARYAHRTLREPTAPGLIHIGDAWHSASPQLGGANMALLDAYALALALRGQPNTGDAIGRAVALRRRHVGLYQLMSALFTPAYQSDSSILPFVRDRVVGPVSTLWPATWIQAAMVSGLIGNPLKPLGLAP